MIITNLSVTDYLSLITMIVIHYITTIATELGIYVLEENMTPWKLNLTCNYIQLVIWSMIFQGTHCQHIYFTNCSCFTLLITSKLPCNQNYMQFAKISYNNYYTKLNHQNILQPSFLLRNTMLTESLGNSYPSVRLMPIMAYANDASIILGIIY